MWAKSSARCFAAARSTELSQLASSQKRAGRHSWPKAGCTVVEMYAIQRCASYRSGVPTAGSKRVPVAVSAM